jgi:RNA polymerase sigma-70 factor (ECF subfamily)
MDDADLVCQVLQGNPGAYGDLVDRYAAPIAAVCRAHVRRSDVVEELIQETFFRGLDRLASLREPDKFGGWLCAIARNLAREWLRDPARRHVDLELATSQLTVTDAADGYAHADRIVRVKTCVDHLPTKAREVVLTYYGGGRITYREMAELFGVSFGQINKWLTIARKQVRNCLERDQLP